jgi:hypothetical protein
MEVAVGKSVVGGEACAIIVEVRCPKRLALVKYQSFRAVVAVAAPLSRDWTASSRVRRLALHTWELAQHVSYLQASPIDIHINLGLHAIDMASCIAAQDR